MTENEAIVRSEVIRAGLLSGTDMKIGSNDENIEYIDAAIDALEEIQQYRDIGTVEECLRNKDFLDFLSDKMNPNDFEVYLRLYNSQDEKGRDEE